MERAAVSLLYVFVASSMEGQPVRKIGTPAGSDVFHCGPNDVVLITGGIGPARARNTADIAFGNATNVSAAIGKADAALVIGLCGGLTESLREGSIVAYRECLSSEPMHAPIRCSETITDSLTSLLSSSDLHCERVVGI